MSTHCTGSNMDLQREWLPSSSSLASCQLASPLLWSVHGQTNSTFVSLKKRRLINEQHNSGRRKLCLVFCITYTISCICIMIPFVPILFFGRLLGGFSTSILFSSFESWLISSANSLSLPSSDLSTIMGRATLINGIVATAAGVVSNQLVGVTHNFVSPFLASGVLLMFAWVLIRRKWTENYGSQNAMDRDLFQIKRLGQAWSIVRKGCFVYLTSNALSFILTFKPDRSFPYHSGPYANMLRRLDVSLRLPLGSVPPRIRCQPQTSPRLHLLFIHDLYDVRISSIHRDSLSTPTTTTITQC